MKDIFHINRFPAEVITVDVTGRRFQRMCNARKSMTNYIAIGDHNNLNDDVQTIKRRSRSRKPRGKRRNTIAGTDQREIEEAANGYVSIINYSPYFMRNDNIPNGNCFTKLFLEFHFLPIYILFHFSIKNYNLCCYWFVIFRTVLRFKSNKLLFVSPLHSVLIRFLHGLRFNQMFLFCFAFCIFENNNILNAFSCIPITTMFCNMFCAYIIVFWKWMKSGLERGFSNFVMLFL